MKVANMEQYDKEFLGYMKSKYKLTLYEATNGTEPQIIKFAVAWDIWKRAKNVYHPACCSNVVHKCTKHL